MISRLIFKTLRMILMMIFIKPMTWTSTPSLFPLLLLPSRPLGLKNPRNLADKQRNARRERGRTNTGAFDGVHGASGRLRFAIRGLGTFNTAEEAARVYDAEARRIRDNKAKVNFTQEAPKTCRNYSANANQIRSCDVVKIHDQNCHDYPIYMEEKPQINQPDDIPLFFNSDEGAKSFGPSEDGHLMEAAYPRKKQKTMSGEGGAGETHSGEVSASESEMKLFEMPYLEDGWDALLGSIETDVWSFEDVPCMVGGTF